MKPTTLLLATAFAAAATAREPTSCLTQDYDTLLNYPLPWPTDEAIYMPLIDYGSDQQVSCMKAGMSNCGLGNPSFVCGFSTGGPSSAQSAWTSLISDAADWWTSNGEQIRSLRSECPDSWYHQALDGSYFAERAMEGPLAWAQCWASAQGETLSPLSPTPKLGAAANIGAGTGSEATGSTPARTGAAPTATDKDDAAAGVRAWGGGVVGLVAVVAVLVV